MKTRYLDGLPFATLEINSKEIEALIDTGFSGSILLPLEEVIKLKLKSEGFTDCILGNGRKERMEVFKAELNWFEDKKPVKVISSELDLPLIGMKLLNLVKTTIEPSKDIIKIEESS